MTFQLLTMFYLQKENAQNVKVVVNDLLAQIKYLENYEHKNEELGISLRFRLFFTMVDSGLVIKYFDIAPMKCRICVKTMEQFRKEQLENAVVSYIHPGSIEFGPSVCHTKLHLTELLLDYGARKESKSHRKRGFAEMLRLGKREMHDVFLRYLNIHVNEPRAGGAGNSNVGKYQFLLNNYDFSALIQPY